MSMDISFDFAWVCMPSMRMNKTNICFKRDVSNKHSGPHTIQQINFKLIDRLPAAARGPAFVIHQVYIMLNQ